MKQYLISMYQPAGEGLPEPEFLAEVMRKIDAIHDELVEAGSWVFGNGLHAPETATVLRLQGDEVLITDGPYVEGKEYLTGEAVAAYDAAIARTDNHAEQAHLRRVRDLLLP
ncbi:YciI family protein [Micromonospora sp. NPDC006431]|uniref:YciI family protein n=1 Tax=Micromonospora sp. NPDC006431 TaxID=3364235 RepID=UPI0036D0D46B